MLSPRLTGIAALSALALVLSGCGTDSQTAVGIDELKIATLGPITEAQQAFVDRMNELSEGSVALDVTENFSGGEDALAQAVQSGEIDMAWVTIRSLKSLGVTGIDSLEAPLLVQSHDQQRAVALGVPGELITNSLKGTGVTGLALLPGPIQYPVATGAPLIALSDWAGKTVQVSPQNPVEATGVEAFGATAGEGAGSVADLVSGSISATTANPADLVAGGVTATGPFLTSNVALWPRMSMIVINTSILERLSNRQHGFLDGSVVRAQDLAMTAPDVVTTVTEACAAGAKFGTATAEQLTALTEAVLPVYEALKGDSKEKKLFEALQETVKRNAGTGAFGVAAACRWVAPKA